MEDKLVEANGEYFQVRMERDIPFWDKSGKPGKSWKGKIYALIGEDLNLFYRDDSSEPTEDITKARLWMEFSYCWRGVWEGRVYFKQEEFWGEDMKVISELWDKIEEIAKEQIKTDNPDYEHFD